MNREISEFFTHIWRGGRWAHYWTPRGAEYTDGDGESRWAARSLWLPVDNIPAIPAPWAGRDVYFSVNPTNRKRSDRQKTRNEDVCALNCLYAEFDAKAWDGGKPAILAHLDELPRAAGLAFPSAIVDSGGGYHCYWLLENPFVVHTDEDRAHVAAVQAAWVELVGSDPAVKDLARVLRVPGTRNHKYTPPRLVEFVEYNPRRLFPFELFDALTATIRAAKEAEGAPSVRVDNSAALGLGDQELLDKAMTAQSNGAQFRSLWSGDLSTVGGDHSAADQALVNLLAFWTGKDEARMDRLFRQSGLYRPKWEREDYRRGTLENALKGVRNVYDPSKANDMSDATRAAQGAVGMSTGRTNGTGPHMNGAGAHTNGANGTNGTNGTNGAGGTGPQSGPVDPLGELLSELVAVEDDRAAVMRWALDNVAALAGLAEAEFAILCLELKARGVTGNWLTGDLRRAVDGERKDQTTGPIWTDYIQAAAKLGYHFRLNVLGDTLEVNGAPMTDVYAAVLLSKLHAQGLKNANVAQRAFLTEADRRRFHPVKEYLEGLTWDGQDHIAALAGYFTDTHDPITYGDGTQRTVFHAFLRRWLVGAVAKVYNPTEAQNPMLILDGEQGKGKSFFAKWICPLAELHFEGAIRPDDKDYLRYLATKWVWEVGELGATMRKADREALKEFITKQDITVRVAFGRYPLEKPALASFIGTVNFDGALLADPTGHRRFWPVNLSAIDWGYSQTVDVAQLWAQAFALYKAGETWKLSTAERAAHAAITEVYEVEDVLGEYILQHFTVNPANDALYTHTTEIVDKLRNIAQLRGSDRAVAMQIASSLNKLGLKKAKRNNRWGYMGITPIKPIP